MPRRRPRHLDAVRFEMGTFERQLAKDAILVQGMKSAALPLAAGLLGLGVATAGFLMYNKVDDLKDWVANQWDDGFGLVADPAVTQEQVSNYVSPNRNPAGMDGMSAFSIYELHYNMRDDLRQYFAQMWCDFNGLEWTGETDARFNREVWSHSLLGTPIQNQATFRFERDEVILIAGEDVNEISEYVYQMIIRETDSRNTQARLMSGALGAVSTGIGAAFSEATHWALRSSGFMRGGSNWDGQNWEQADGANRDPLLMYAWGRTDFQTGKWWSTVDSQGDVAFWLDVAGGGHGGTRRIRADFENPESWMDSGIWSYEQIIYYAHRELSNDEWGPFILFLAEAGSMPLIKSTQSELEPPEETLRERQEREDRERREREEAIRQAEKEQEETETHDGLDPDYEPDDSDPNDQYGPPR